MLELVHYSPESSIRPHVTIAGSRVCEDDIKDRYGHVPAKRKMITTFWLDPGGFAFADTEPIRFEVNGVQIGVKPEHLYVLDGLKTRILADTDWVKVYFTPWCLVLPVPMWGEILNIANAFAAVYEDGRVLLAERIKDIPNVGIKKK
jgi:hypothetical protein